MKDLISPAIHETTQAILADYDQGRSIDKLDVFNQPDTKVIYELINELVRIAYPGFSKDKHYRIYDIRNNLSMVIEDVAFRLNKQISIALRYIPILMEETDKIMKAQEARGADFTSGGLIARAKAMVPLLVPLFVSAFRRASDLAMALEARCYQGGVRRTRMKPLRYRKNDAIAYLVLAAFLTVMILQRVFL